MGNRQLTGVTAVVGGAVALTLVAACGSSPSASSSSSSSSASSSSASSSTASSSSMSSSPSSSGSAGGAAGAAGLTAGLSKDPKLAALVPKQIRSSGSVTVATDPTYAPMEFIGSNNTTIVGVDPDLGAALGKILGITFNFQKASFDGIIPGLASGKYQLGMSSFGDTKQREKVVDFVTYMRAGTQLLVPKGNPKHLSPQGMSLCGQTVAAEKGTIQDQDIAARSKKCVSAGKKAINEKTYPDQNSVNLALSTGRIDAALADSGVAGYMAAKSHGAFQTAGNAYSPVPYAIAVPKNDGTFTKALQGAMNKLIASPDYLKILKKWSETQGAITKSQINVAKS
ncbi:MAG TPA: ABC transporter substrate-binding protein [Segeticoccus sp.]|uniref:ABC transporter substrate-binding protein n=1 Tax=Segeticoccus sp. TaxID=2706531 RepID=UPI002D807306|nr:ABC transporter substrate-binding protein [Segeticoccus sp.]HET8601207.1 ABC transporter substrate-binding protein [Segeticoccus sp.]